MRRRAALVVGWVVVVATLSFGRANDVSAATLPVGSCTTTANVVVAVDFAHWGGPIVRACGSTPTTGFDLLNQGGFHTVGTQHDGPGFVCRVSSSSFGGAWYPPADAPGESCVLTPPATAYWSYWHADAGQNSWSYSPAGATSSSPGPGSVDLWVFGATSTGGGSGSGVPSFSPDAVRARNTEPTPVVPATTSAHPAGSSPTGGPRPTRATTGSIAPPASTTSRATPSHSTPSHSTPSHSTPSHSTPNPTHLKARSTPATRARATPTTTPVSAAGTGPTPIVVDAKPVAVKRASSGSAWPVIIGVVPAAFLAGGAGLTVLRRRQSGRT